MIVVFSGSRSITRHSDNVAMVEAVLLGLHTRTRNWDSTTPFEIAMLDNEEATGAYTSKADARQKGCSIHYHWPNRVDVLDVTSRFIEITNESPAKLFWLVDKILTAAGRPLEDA